MSQRTYRRNIRAWLNGATVGEYRDGLEWYDEGRSHVARIATKYNVDPVTVAHVIAALSPRNKWEVNLRDAERFVEAYVTTGVMPESASTFRSNRRMAWNCLMDGARVRGRKVAAFAANLSGDERAVTVDTWAIRAATNGHVDMVANLGTYREVARAYQHVADERGLASCDAQAIVWVAARNAA